MTGHINTFATMPHGKLAVSDDRILKILDLNSGESITAFHADTQITVYAVSPVGKTIVAGDSGGNVHFLRLENADAES